MNQPSIHYLTPLWERLAGHICRLILQGEMKENESLPGIREMAGSHEVNLHTMERALSDLQEAGVLAEENGRLKISSSKQAAAYLMESFTRNTLPPLASQMRLLNLSPSQLCQLLEKQQNLL